MLKPGDYTAGHERPPASRWLTTAALVLLAASVLEFSYFRNAMEELERTVAQRIDHFTPNPATGATEPIKVSDTLYYVTKEEAARHSWDEIYPYAGMIGVVIAAYIMKRRGIVRHDPWKGTEAFWKRFYLKGYRFYDDR